MVSTAIGALPKFQSGPWAGANSSAGHWKPINVCAVLPGRVEALEWKLLKQRSQAARTRIRTRGRDCLLLASEVMLLSQQLTVSIPSALYLGDRGHETTAKVQVQLEREVRWD
jgi:hypothetical protein